ncbi:hypothetical protein AA23498_2018 [Acetobacter nitrogenifigens DSM 23921 = NBRC 105050]|uniref:Uncharacterized protein n=1 Tax=Acetobacter nitrogenifigens DSM 23921 = NBRC 105050 TaxID=1120919 RepID=A0A511X6F5_9PROT|nr:hypothetical protein [Acetobacter nitrogenifigens]GBQ94402.1 hypothetical protein AA23498_2018 [Acetobacter nitrogenifigens DSM 23921 = NBRC 105050]GEN58511.1 hypothetical protein ANI02nite_03950 [Acetobacter nitrogenifigens DSM 23921 = NBRC 105050]
MAFRKTSPRPGDKSTNGRPGVGFGKKPRTLRQHIIRRLIMVVPLSLGAIFLARSGILDRMVDSYTFQPTSWFDDSALVRHLRNVVTHNGMTGDRPDCLLFIVDGNSPPDGTKIDVMEKHSGSCPNPDKSLPKLFTLKVDRVDRQVFSDQGSPGTFHLIPNGAN